MRNGTAWMVCAVLALTAACSDGGSSGDSESDLRNKSHGDMATEPPVTTSDDMATAGTTPPSTGTTADDSVPAYDQPFAYGSNMGYFGSQWTDEQVANLLVGGADAQAGVGVKSLRAALYNDFLTDYGATVRVSTFQHYQAIGAAEQVVFINANGEQTNNHDPNSYAGCASQSQLQQNMYLPIFITNSAGQQVVNPANDLAAYVQTLASTYKGLGIRFYEVYNEPDFTYNWVASSVTTDPTYWGTVNPNPCDLPNTYAPISHHVRLHRIIYEVVHATDPDALVATGGIGYPGYLDALLRNTDNPGSYVQNAGEGDGTVEGVASTRYPKGGGAYFDVLSFHSYPQFALSTYQGSAAGCTAGQRYNTPDSRCYFEHSDAAVAAMLGLKASMQATLAAHGYDGTTHPLKHFILTETNVPREPAQYASGTTLSPTINQWGSSDYAKNYAIKALVDAQKNGIQQLYLYGSSDEVQANGTDCSGNMVGTDDTKIEGMFLDLACVSPYAVTPTVQATAYRSTSSFLYGYAFDATETAKLALPATLDGGAFKNSAGQERYALWLKTTTDRTETGSATYAFPAGTAVGSTVTVRAWDFSSSNASTSTSSSSVTLSPTPSFIE